MTISGDERSGLGKGIPRGKRPKNPRVLKATSSKGWNYPSIQLFENVVELYDKLLGAGGEWKKLKDIAEEANEKTVQAYYKDLKRMEEFLQRKLIKLTPGRGTKKLERSNRLIEQMREIVERVEALREDAQKVRLKVATSPMLSIRLLSPLIAAYHARHTGAGEDLPEIDVTLMSPGNLVDEAFDETNDFDVIITFGEKRIDPSKIEILAVGKPPNFRSDAAPSAPDDASSKRRQSAYSSYRCILARRDTGFTKEYRSRIESGEFDYEWLAGRRVAMLPREKRIPGFPHTKIARHATRVPAGSSLEAHALVRAGTAELTFTHVDLLSDVDLRSLCYIDLSRVKDDDLRCTYIYPIKGARDVLSEAEQEHQDAFLGQVAEYFEKIEARHAESIELTESLRKFRYSYHTTFVDDGGVPKHAWVRGELDLEACVLQRERKEPTRYVGGSYNFRDLAEPKGHFLFFGKIMDLGGGGTRRLWRGSLAEDDSVGFSFAFDEGDLEGKPHLCGTWVGRPTLIDRDEIQVFGFMLFSKEEIIDVRELTKHVNEFRKSIAGRYGSLNPINDWPIPPGIYKSTHI